MTWRVAASLLALRDEIDRRSPDRSKASDGTIGNAAHAARSSDHNPWVKDGDTGVVTAADFTNDPAHGFDSSDFADWLRERCRDGDETRVKYVISDRRIASAALKPGHKHWDWRAYDGPNAHLHHVHVSVRSDRAHYDNTSPWGWEEEEMVDWNERVKLSDAGRKLLKDEDGQVKVIDLLMGYGPGIRSARNELKAGFAAVTAQLGAQQALIKQLVGALAAGGSLTEQQAEHAAEAGARAALEKLAAALGDGEDTAGRVSPPAA